MWFVYILQCEDNSLYTGATNDVAHRFAAHCRGVGGKYTRAHLPVRIVYTEPHTTKSAALKREAAIKQWTRTQKISQLALQLADQTQKIK